MAQRADERALAEACRAGGSVASTGKRVAPDPKGPVLELLQNFSIRDCGGFYDGKVRGKLLRFDTSGGRRVSADASANANRKKHARSLGRNREAQASNQWKDLCYDELAPLRELWASYIEDLLQATGGGGRGGTACKELAEVLAAADLHGCTLGVVRAKNPGCVHLRGTVVEETQRTFRIVTMDDRVLVLPKERCIFEVEVRGARVQLLGRAWMHRLPGGVPGPMTPKGWGLK